MGLRDLEQTFIAPFLLYGKLRLTIVPKCDFFYLAAISQRLIATINLFIGYITIIFCRIGLSCSLIGMLINDWMTLNMCILFAETDFINVRLAQHSNSPQVIWYCYLQTNRILF